MNNRLLAFVAALSLLAAPAFAQTYNTPTTLSSAVTSPSATSIIVASTTGFVNGYVLYIDREAMTVSSFNATTKVVQVFRGAMGTQGTTHLASAYVIWGLPANFITSDRAQPVMGGGSCTAANWPTYPIVNVQNGNVWLCRPMTSTYQGNGSQWTATNGGNLSYNSVLYTLP